MQRKRSLEIFMALVLLIAVYMLSQQGANLVSKQMAKNHLVILDPGHGGDDPGKIGVQGTKEKTINLEISELVKEKLEQEGVRVAMTRESDDGLYDANASNKKVQDLQRRVQMIDEMKPDCVVSIHQNSYPESSIKGAQVFYYTDSVEGKKLAEQLQDSLVANLDPTNHRQAKGNTTYYMLKKTDAVIVICECGFLSNPEEEALLSSTDYQERVADAVCKGILAYLEKGIENV